jgi:hypothetical protein
LHGVAGISYFTRNAAAAGLEANGRDLTKLEVSTVEMGLRQHPDHRPYFNQAMAREQLEAMRHFGFERFALCSHDRRAVGVQTSAGRLIRRIS